MYDKLLEKHKNSVFQISKIDKAFRNFDFNSTIWEKNTLGCAIIWKYSRRKVSVN